MLLTSMKLVTTKNDHGEDTNDIFVIIRKKTCSTANWVLAAFRMANLNNFTIQIP